MREEGDGLLVPARAAALRQNNFDAIRLAMSLAVVWSHSFALWRGSEASEPVSLLLGGLYNSGNLAVLVFFTISGFLITLSYERSSSWLSYLRRRFARIYPGYLVAIAICSLVVVPAFSTRPFADVSSEEWWRIASNLALRGYIIPSDAFGGGPVNGSLWSIPLEFWCYLGVLGLGVVGALRRRYLWPLLAAGVVAMRIWLELIGWQPGGGMLGRMVGVPWLWCMVLPSFCLGAAALCYRDSIPRSGWLLLALVLVLIASTHLPLDRLHIVVLPFILVPLILAYGTFYFAFARRIRLHGVARYGDFSYGAYLYAFPIQQMLVTLLKGRTGFPVFILASLALSLLAGVISWMLVERWFLARVRRRPLDQEAALVAP